MAELDSKIATYTQAGLSEEDIAVHLGKEVSYIKSRLESIFKKSIDSDRATRALNVNIARTEEILNGSYENACNGDKDAFGIVHKCMEMQAKLLGLNAPEKLQLNTSTFQINIIDNHSPIKDVTIIDN